MKTYALSLIAAAASATILRLDAQLESSIATPSFSLIYLDTLSSSLKSAYENNGLCVEFNEQLELAVASNPTTGYEWKAHDNQSNGAFWISTRYEPSPQPANMAGAGGMFEATIKGGTSEADGQITLEEKRSWESEISNSYSFPVHVRSTCAADHTVPSPAPPTPPGGMPGDLTSGSCSSDWALIDILKLEL